jgi:hypothetical protein
MKGETVMGLLDNIGGFVKDTGDSIGRAAGTGNKAASDAWNTAVEDAKASANVVGTAVRDAGSGSSGKLPLRGSKEWDDYSRGGTNVFWSPFSADQAAEKTWRAAKTAVDFKDVVLDQVQEGLRTIYNGVNSRNPYSQPIDTKPEGADAHARALESDLKWTAGQLAGKAIKPLAEKVGDAVEKSVANKVNSWIGDKVEGEFSVTVGDLTGAAAGAATKYGIEKSGEALGEKAAEKAVEIEHRR